MSLYTMIPGFLCCPAPSQLMPEPPAMPTIGIGSRRSPSPLFVDLHSQLSISHTSVVDLFAPFKVDAAILAGNPSHTKY